MYTLYFEIRTSLLSTLEEPVRSGKIPFIIFIENHWLKE
jgi:hypothetical protein